MRWGPFGRIAVIALMCTLRAFGAKAQSCGAGDRIGANGTRETLNAAYGLVDRFYGCLFDEFDEVKCRGILDDTSLTATQIQTVKTRGDERWHYLKGHWTMFITPRYGSRDEKGKREFFSKAAKSVTYFNIRDVKELTYGEMYLSLSSTTMGAGRDGIYKEVSFPIVCDQKKGEYRIRFLGIKINGILIDPYREFISREFDLLEKLGIRESSGVRP